MTSFFHITGQNQLDDVMFGRVRHVAAPVGDAPHAPGQSVLSSIALFPNCTKLIPGYMKIERKSSPRPRDC